ncbi:MAG: transcription antitermination factor NusB [Endomicrobium sp.]|jgi:N utilization substance protein B|nr:transcription antitermination factor NusB [Endomicrobium sp.]
MSTRREARECSLRMLYMLDNCAIKFDDVCNYLSEYLPKRESYKIFAINLFKGVCENKQNIDFFINLYTKNWELERMAVVDRNIIRLATYEIMATPDISVNVIINEAVEISKKFSTKDSSKFINGVLDKLKIIRTQKIVE